MQHGTHLTAGEGGEGEFLGETFAVQLRQEMAQAGVNLVAAVGQQDKQGGSSTAPRQVMEKFQAGLITPMQILNDRAAPVVWLSDGGRVEPARRRDGVSPARDQVGAARGRSGGRGRRSGSKGDNAEAREPISVATLFKGRGGEV